MLARLSRLAPVDRRRGGGSTDISIPGVHETRGIPASLPPAASRGDEPPFHTPCFVLTHHPRPPIELTGTTFYFIDASPEEALAEARAAANGLDVRIGGGPTTAREFLAADLIDYLRIVVAPIVLGRGERLRDGLEAIESRFDGVQVTAAPSGVTHIVFERPG